MVVADVSFADIFWSVLWFFFLFIWLMILFQILSDLFRDHSVSGVEKTLWVLFLVFLPFLAVFIYLIVHATLSAARTWSSIRLSPALTCSAPNPMKPPSLAASAAACAAATSTRPGRPGSTASPSPRPMTARPSWPARSPTRQPSSGSWPGCAIWARPCCWSSI